jgi:predicted nuclease of predicted toxin-antitoxin system
MSPQPFAVGLRQRGIDVTTAASAGLASASDSEHLEFALSSGRVLVTQDADFLRLHAEGNSHAGIVYCRQQSRSIGEFLRFLLLIQTSLTQEDMIRKVEFL